MLALPGNSRQTLDFHSMPAKHHLTPPTRHPKTVAVAVVRRIFDVKNHRNRIHSFRMLLPNNGQF